MHAQTRLKEENGYMPIRLKRILAEAGLRQAQWARAVHQYDGRPLSPTVATLLLNWNIWPKLTAREAIETQTAGFLAAQGVAPAAIAEAFALDETAAARGAPPRGAPFHSSAHGADDHAPEKEMLSAAARKAFQLFRDPFVDDVQGPEDVFLSPDQRYVREAMFQTAKHGGFIAVIGESGAGKTVLRRDLLDRIAREALPIAVIAPRTFDKTQLTTRAICEAILGDLAANETPKRTLERLARQIERLLVDSSRAGQAHVLIIEEAHDLSVATLKYLKRFWELEDGFKKLLSIILIGQPELKAKLNERQNFEAREVIRRCEQVELLPLDAHLDDYLTLKLKRIGKSPSDVFEADALDAMRVRLMRAGPRGEAVSMLYPLVVNNLVTRALNLAATLGAPRLSGDIVKEA